MYHIEIMGLRTGQWTFYESLEASRDDVLSHIRLIRCSFPNFSVRAVESDSGQLLRLCDREVTESV
jgi:ribulose bisphosphate carboxylase small subunit